MKIGKLQLSTGTYKRISPLITTINQISITEPRTLRLTWPVGKTLLLTFPMLLLLLGLTEVTLRASWAQIRLTGPDMGGSHWQLGDKLVLLERFARKDGHVKCIALGSSMMDLGFDPVAFEQGYFDQTGEVVRCFNFAIDALPAVGTAALAEILLKDYQPELLIYGTDARDYSVKEEHEDAQAILAGDWLQYRTGRTNIRGWLLEHFYLYRYWWHLRQLWILNFEDVRRIPDRQTDLGQTPYQGSKTDAFSKPDLNVKQLRYYANLLSSFEMRDENMAGLAQLLRHNGKNTNVVIVEMPIPDGYFYFFEDSDADYSTFVTGISRLTTQYHTLFLRTDGRIEIPQDSWFDHVHLNVTGAEAFSNWLGKQIGKAVVDGYVDHSSTDQ